MKYEEIYFLKDSGYFGTYEVTVLVLLIISLLLFIRFTKLTIVLNRAKDEPKATNNLMISIFIFFILCLVGLGNVLAYKAYLSAIKVIDEKNIK